MQAGAQTDYHRRAAMVREAQPQIRAMVADEVAQYRLSTERMRTHAADWTLLREKGVFVRVEVRGISQLFRKTLWADLGISETEVTSEWMTTGVSKVLPKEYVNPLDSMDGRFRKWLDSYSYDVEGFRPFRYLLKGEGSYDAPGNSAYWNFYRKYEELLEIWDQRKARILDNYDEIRTIVENAYREIAGSSFQRLKARMKRDLTQSYETFRERMVARAMEAFPTKEQLDQRLTVSLIPGVLLNPAEMERILIQTEEIASERDAIELHQVNMLAMQLMDTPSPFDTVFNECGAWLFDAATDSLASIDAMDAPYLTRTSYEKLAGLRPRYAMMAIARDPSIDAALAVLDRALAVTPVQGPIAGPAGRPDMQPVRSALAGIIAAAEPFKLALLGIA